MLLHLILGSIKTSSLKLLWYTTPPFFISLSSVLESLSPSSFSDNVVVRMSCMTFQAHWFFFIIIGNILNYMSRITITYFEHSAFCYLWGYAIGKESFHLWSIKNYILFNMKKFHIYNILLNNTTFDCPNILKRISHELRLKGS